MKQKLFFWELLITWYYSFAALLPSSLTFNTQSSKLLFTAIYTPNIFFIKIYIPKCVTQNSAIVK